MRRALLPIVVVVAVAVFAVPALSDAPIRQPIAYNHHLHVEQEGLVCADCHVQAEDHARATIPPLSICMDCHGSDPLTESPEEKKLIGYIESGVEIPWRQVYTVPDHVYFSHRRHVVLGELDCSTCHGRVAERVDPVTTPEEPPSMDWCMDCHRSRGVTGDCLSCHR